MKSSLLLVLALAACHNSGGGTSDFPNEGGDAQPTSYLGAKPTEDGKGLINKATGKEYKTPEMPANAEWTYSVVPKDGQKQVYLSTKGDHATALSVAIDDPKYPEKNFNSFTIFGTPTANMPDGNMVYHGEYRVMSAENPMIANVSYDIVMAADFGIGDLKGQSASDGKLDKRVSITGAITGQNVSMIIKDEIGYHEAEGRVFGPKAETIMAGYSADKYVGIVHARVH